jgi:hypothetical protein
LATTSASTVDNSTAATRVDIGAEASGLETGAIIGIAVGAAICGALITAIVVIVSGRSRRTESPNSNGRALDRISNSSTAELYGSLPPRVPRYTSAGLKSVEVEYATARVFDDDDDSAQNA